jgi:hypothetical protein
MDEVTNISDDIKNSATTGRFRKASRYAIAALVGAAALAVVAKKVSSSDNTEQE